MLLAAELQYDLCTCQFSAVLFLTICFLFTPSYLQFSLCDLLCYVWLITYSNWHTMRLRFCFLLTLVHSDIQFLLAISSKLFWIMVIPCDYYRYWALLGGWEIFYLLGFILIKLSGWNPPPLSLSLPNKHHAEALTPLIMTFIYPLVIWF